MKIDNILPSLLSANFNDLNTQLKNLKKEGIKEIHFDVMDGKFVKNISFGAKILADIAKNHDFYWDVHLMISDPILFFKSFVLAGANSITYHYETNIDHMSFIREIKKNNIHVGLALKPSTPIMKIEKFLPFLDKILIMSVNPGFGGQQFKMETIKKIEELKAIIKKQQLETQIYVDGGIDDKTIKLVSEVGADKVVVGSYLFNPNKSLKIYLESLRKK